ncbi:MAG: DNA-processing protein DprA [Bernardetiaceae bacterium]|nr:DNA-processing protein DprA [Bernardetiaceae bacterium]
MLYILALSMLPNVGSKNAKLLMSYCGSAEKVFKLPAGKLTRVPNIGKLTADAIVAHREDALKRAEKQLQIAEKQQVQILPYTHEDFPQRFRNHDDMPFLIFKKGKASLNQPRSVAIVGTRKATDYGKNFTADIIKDLKKYKPMIVSGLAYGIDIQAHRSALQQELPTIAALASGLDTIYPAAHKNTAEQICQNGALISEYPFGVKPEARHFPHRNRLIAALADVVLVAEAAIKGGALITAEIANVYGKDVFALPGSLDMTYSEGCNHLIKTHKAHLLTSISDIDYIARWDTDDMIPAHNNGIEVSTTKPKKTALFQELPESERRIAQVIQTAGGTLAIDEIAIKAELPMSEVSVALFQMEFKDLIKALPGKQYQLT